MTDYDHGFHVWDRPIRTVAVIGSGPSGTPCARHLQAAGLNVKVFERQPVPGGIWNWSSGSTPPMSVPTPPPSMAAFDPVARGRQGTRVYNDAGGDDAERFNPANPVYWNLENNVSTTTLAVRILLPKGGTTDAD
jgi:thioredoxin reductase